MGLPALSRAIPGASLTTVTVSDPKPLDSSLFEPPRMIMATSSEPEPSSATLKPAAMDSNATSTRVTPPMPSTATSDDDQRCGMFRRFMPVTAAICVKPLAMSVSSTAPQGVDDLQSHGGEPGPEARDHAEGQHQAHAHEDGGVPQAERREVVLH